MLPEFYSLEMLVRMYYAAFTRSAALPGCYRPLCDETFFTALAQENNQ